MCLISALSSRQLGAFMIFLPWSLMKCWSTEKINEPASLAAVKKLTVHMLIVILAGEDFLTSSRFLMMWPSKPMTWLQLRRGGADSSEMNPEILI